MTNIEKKVIDKSEYESLYNILMINDKLNVSEIY